MRRTCSCPLMPPSISAWVRTGNLVATTTSVSYTHLDVYKRQTLERIVQAAENMLSYHEEPGRGMDHPYYAPWYRWPFSEIPMYYAMDHNSPAGYAYAIWAFGNYAVWWTGFVALLAVLYAWGKHQALPVLCRGYRCLLYTSRYV